MKLVFLFMFFFLATMVSAGTENVMFDFKLRYEPNPTTNCSLPVFDSLTNHTWNNCTTINDGTIYITGFGEEIILTITKSLKDIIANPGEKLTGYKIADLGNLSDITGINDKLESFVNCNDKLNLCMDSNREVSAKLILLEEDSGLKSNFTECSTNLIKTNADLDIRQNDIKIKNEKIEDLESSKIMWMILGGIIGAVLIGVVVPKMRGTDLPKSSTGNDFPPNPGYT